MREVIKPLNIIFISHYSKNTASSPNLNFKGDMIDGKHEYDYMHQPGYNFPPHAVPVPVPVAVAVPPQYERGIQHLLLFQIFQ